MNDEKEYAGSYEIQQVVEVGRKRFVIGVDEKNPDPYMVADSRPLMGGYFYENVGTTMDYLEVLEEFINRQKNELEWVRADRKERKSDCVPFEITDCLKSSNTKNYTGQILVVDAAKMPPEFRVKEHQLVLGQCGFGVNPNSRGRKIFGRDLWTGEKVEISRYNVLGILKPQVTPKWASENAALFIEQEKRKGEERG